MNTESGSRPGSANTGAPEARDSPETAAVEAADLEAHLAIVRVLSQPGAEERMLAEAEAQLRREDQGVQPVSCSAAGSANTQEGDVTVSMREKRVKVESSLESAPGPPPLPPPFEEPPRVPLTPVLPPPQPLDSWYDGRVPDTPPPTPPKVFRTLDPNAPGLKDTPLHDYCWYERNALLKKAQRLEAKGAYSAQDIYLFNNFLVGTFPGFQPRKEKAAEKEERRSAEQTFWDCFQDESKTDILASSAIHKYVCDRIASDGLYPHVHYLLQDKESHLHLFHSGMIVVDTDGTILSRGRRVASLLSMGTWEAHGRVERCTGISVLGKQ